MVADPKHFNLSLALEASVDPICILDPQGRILSLNIGMVQLLKCKKRDLTRPTQLLELLEPRSPADREEIQAALASGTKLQNDDLKIHRKNEELRVILKLTPIRVDKSLQGFVAVVRDLTADLALQVKYRSALKELETQEAHLRSLSNQLKRTRLIQGPGK